MTVLLDAFQAVRPVDNHGNAGWRLDVREPRGEIAIKNKPRSSAARPSLVIASRLRTDSRFALRAFTVQQTPILGTKASDPVGLWRDSLHCLRRNGDYVSAEMKIINAGKDFG